MSAAHAQSTEDVSASISSADANGREEVLAPNEPTPALPVVDDEKVEGDDEEEDEEDREPNLKYTRLTSSAASLYRNGDSTSAFAVTGDKMVRRIGQTGRLRAYMRLTSGRLDRGHS